jgi:hypothetical protein
VSAVNPLVAFYNIHGRKEEVLSLLFWAPHKTKWNIEIVKYSICSQDVFNLFVSDVILYNLTKDNKTNLLFLIRQ